MGWDCTVEQITHIKPIENSDFIELAIVVGRPCVVKKGMYKVGDLVSYCPEESVIPEEILEKVGLKGKLSGRNKNKVKAIRLRGQFSVGVLLPVPEGFTEGQSVANYYDIVRLEPELPFYLAGKARRLPPGFTKYDLESGYKYLSRFLEPDANIIVTEKIHGCNASFALTTEDFYVNSRNLSLLETEDNLYWKMAHKFNLKDKLQQIKAILQTNEPIYLYAEIFGRGVQDLTYGAESPEIRAFDIKVGNRFLDWLDFEKIVSQIGIPHVPVLFRGLLESADLTTLVSGKEQVSGKELHIREGIVICPIREVIREHYGRCKLKMVSEEYLLRKDGTEFH